MMKRRVLLVLAWLALIDIVPTVVYLGIILSWPPLQAPPALPWASALWSWTLHAVRLGEQLPELELPLGPSAWAPLAYIMASLFLSLLVPWWLFKLAARERRKAPLPTA